MEEVLNSSRSAALVLVFCSTLAAAQATAPAKTPDASAKKPAVSVSPKIEVWKPVPGTGANGDEAVISVDVPCPATKAATPKTPCKKVITAAEFLRMAAAINPGMSAPQQRTFATNLARMLAYSSEANRLGLQNTPEGKTLLELGRMQALAQMLGRKLRDQAENVSQADVQAYYRDNKGKFESATIERVLVPVKQVEGAEADKKAEMDYASQLRTRWVAGEDPEKLQKEAFDRSGNKVTPPPVKLGERIPTSLPATQEKVFGLKAGDITEPVYDPSAVVLLKLVSKQTKSLEQVQDDIKKMLRSQRMEKIVDELDKRTPAKINDSFFAPQAEPGVASPSEKKMPPATPPAKEPK